jgi:hydrogenase nickel incorporation protein HypB
MKIEVGKAILHLNDQQSRDNLGKYRARRLVGINVLASPGAGKTSVILQLLDRLSADFSVGVIEGDVASSIDTETVRSRGYPAVQINTHGGCHLDARMVSDAVDQLEQAPGGYFFIENIGNLICPTQYHLGESLRVVIASVPEGDDKPAKYPGVFTTADCVVLNKSDLMGAVSFSLARFEGFLRTANPDTPLFVVSCTTGEGLDDLAAWLRENSPRPGQ